MQRSPASTTPVRLTVADWKSGQAPNIHNRRDLDCKQSSKICRPAKLQVNHKASQSPYTGKSHPGATEYNRILWSLRTGPPQQRKQFYSQENFRRHGRQWSPQLLVATCAASRLSCRCCCSAPRIAAVFGGLRVSHGFTFRKNGHTQPSELDMFPFCVLSQHPYLVAWFPGDLTCKTFRHSVLPSLPCTPAPRYA